MSQRYWFTICTMYTGVQRLATECEWWDTWYKHLPPPNQSAFLALLHRVKQRDISRIGPRGVHHSARRKFLIKGRSTFL